MNAHGRYTDRDCSRSEDDEDFLGAPCEPAPGCQASCEPVQIRLDFLPVSSVRSEIVSRSRIDATGDLLSRAAWPCFTAQGEPSAFEELQTLQVTLLRPTCDVTLLTVCASAYLRERYPLYSVLLEERLLGPFLFGTGFQCPPIQCALQLTLVPCRWEPSEVLSFCETFACALWFSVRTVSPFACASCWLQVCGCIPWVCTSSEDTWQTLWDAGHLRGNCRLQRPHWSFDRVFDKEREPDSVLGTYWGTLLALAHECGPCDIWLNDTAEVEVPFTNAYFTLPELRATEPEMQGDLDAFLHSLDGLNQVPATSPQISVSWDGELIAGFKHLSASCRMAIRGTGTLTGHRLAQCAQRVRPLANLLSGTTSIQELLWNVEYQVNSGLLDVQVSALCPKGAFSLTVDGIGVIYPPPRPSPPGASSVMLNTSVEARKGAVCVTDFKMVGGWIATDGPKTFAPFSLLQNLYFQLAGNSITLSSSKTTHRNVALVQGNGGGAINIGNRGLLPADVCQCCVEYVHVHRICQGVDQSTGVGGMIGCEHVGSARSVRKITISHVYIPFLGGARSGERGGAVDPLVFGPNAVFRLTSVGYLLEDMPAMPLACVDDVAFLNLCSGIVPLQESGTWFYFYLKNRVTDARRLLTRPTLGTFYYTRVPADDIDKRRTYMASASRVFMFSGDSQREAYFRCANAGVRSKGVDSLWLEGYESWKVATNTQKDGIAVNVIYPTK